LSEENRVQEPEDSKICADTDGQCEHHGYGESWRAAELAYRLA
jgi:hypothetical protein